MYFHECTFVSTVYIETPLVWHMKLMVQKINNGTENKINIHIYKDITSSEKVLMGCVLWVFVFEQWHLCFLSGTIQNILFSTKSDKLYLSEHSAFPSCNYNLGVDMTPI